MLTAAGARRLAAWYADRVASWRNEGKDGWWFDLRPGWNFEGCAAVHVGSSGEPPATYRDAAAALEHAKPDDPDGSD